ncbi:MAG: hypothetical protein OXH76_00540 [Boseongicola sp.]|nr:hypothetical protein [Boseongicola sp.]MDE0694305.1 hypothetical protein [Boseongicola sp.]MXX91148.1 hypothetical protein [Boseongicola sp. SB0665_bin_10]MYH58071.1 hypothetical protein [Boseongicola sp. SB0675_bin_26]
MKERRSGPYFATRSARIHPASDKRPERSRDARRWIWNFLAPLALLILVYVIFVIYLTLPGGVIS